MNLPNKMNSLEKDLRDKLASALEQFSEDAKSKVALLTGAGNAFCAGGSLKELGAEMSPLESACYVQEISRLITLITGMKKAVVACVNGAAVGAGFNLALACDIVIASSKAVFSQAFAKVGLIPDLGGLYFLPRIVGVHRAKELIFTSKMLTADEAFEMGFVNHVVEPDELEAFSLEMAQTICRGPAVAFKFVKKILSNSLQMSLEEVMQYESLAQALCIQGDDHKEGVKAFYEKRAPVFKDQ